MSINVFLCLTKQELFGDTHVQVKDLYRLNTNTPCGVN